MPVCHQVSRTRYHWSLVTIAALHGLGDLGKRGGHGRISPAVGQGHADFPEVAALQQGEGLAFGQCHHVRGGQHGHLGHTDAVFVAGFEIDARAGFRGIIHAGDTHQGKDFHAGQLLGEHLRRGQLLDPQHDQRIEVTGHLPRFGFTADTRFDIGPGLGVGRDLKARPAGLVQ